MREGDVSASVTASFGSPTDSTVLAGVIRDAQAQGLIFGPTGNEPLGGSASYPVILSPIVHFEPVGLRVMPVDVYGPAGVVTPFASPVPEPSTISLLAIGAAGLCFAVRRRGVRPCRLNPKGSFERSLKATNG